MSPKKALKLLNKASHAWLNATRYTKRHNLYVWQEGIAGEYKDRDYKEEKRKLKKLELQ